MVKRLVVILKLAITKCGVRKFKINALVNFIKQKHTTKLNSKVLAVVVIVMFSLDTAFVMVILV